MREIRRPTEIGEVGTMLHLAEFLLAQASKILLNITIAPEHAVPGDIDEKARRMQKHVEKALKELEEAD